MRVRGQFTVEFDVSDSDEGYRDFVPVEELFRGRVLPYTKVKLDVENFNEGEIALEDLLPNSDSVKLLSLEVLERVQ